MPGLPPHLASLRIPSQHSGWRRTTIATFTALENTLPVRVRLPGRRNFSDLRRVGTKALLYLLSGAAETPVTLPLLVWITYQAMIQASCTAPCPNSCCLESFLHREASISTYRHHFDLPPATQQNFLFTRQNHKELYLKCRGKCLRFSSTSFIDNNFRTFVG